MFRMSYYLPNLDGALELALMNLLPQTASSMEPVAHKGEEIAFIMEGQVKLYLNDEVLLLNTGDSVKIPPYAKHKWENTSLNKVTVIFGVTPPSFLISNTSEEKVRENNSLTFLVYYNFIFKKIKKLVSQLYVIKTSEIDLFNYILNLFF